jgi:FkbM family methyltransferase
VPLDKIMRWLSPNSRPAANVTQFAFEPEWLGKVGPFKEHHPVFDYFAPFAGSVPVEFEVDFVGTRTAECMLPAFAERSTPEVATTIPGIDEEYFEWIDVLLSAADAAGINQRDSTDSLGSSAPYTMVEVGAGYGRWAVRAALAARSLGITDIRLGLVEAEPAHIAWAREHLSANNISTDHAKIYETAVSDHGGWAEFYVGSPDFSDDTARKWYGQALAHSYEKSSSKADAAAETYYGHPVLTYDSGWKAIRVPKVDIRQILSDFGEIDLLDLDVQGEELRILTAARDALDRQVKRLHIGTHAPNLEDGLRKLLSERGWHLLRDYSCLKTNATPFGEVSFVDGVQSWINPRFRRTPG